MLPFRFHYHGGIGTFYNSLWILWEKVLSLSSEVIEMDEKVCVGHSDMHQFDYWWEKYLPSCLVLYVKQGTAKISLLFHKYEVRTGAVFFITPDLYPAITEASADLDMLYIRCTINFLNDVIFGLPSEFFNAIFLHPFVQADENLTQWFSFIEQMAGNGDNPFMEQLLTDQLHSFSLLYFLELQKRYGHEFATSGNAAEVLCGKFYDLVLVDSSSHRDVSYYAEKLCITANYLSMIIRRYCNESPKRAISRQVISEIKYKLTHTHSDIATISRELHFPDASYMCRYFKKETLMSLTDYRNQVIQT